MIDIWKEMMKVVISKEETLEKCLDTYIDPIEDDQKFADMEDALVELWEETRGLSVNDFVEVQARGLSDRWYCEKYKGSEYKEYAFLYDFNPPYLIGGTVISKTPDRKVRIQGYSPEFFTPLIILPYAMGVEMQQQLNTVYERYEETQRLAEEQLKAVVQKITNGKRWTSI